MATRPTPDSGSPARWSGTQGPRASSSPIRAPGTPSLSVRAVAIRRQRRRWIIDSETSCVLQVVADAAVCELALDHGLGPGVDDHVVAAVGRTPARDRRRSAVPKRFRSGACLGRRLPLGGERNHGGKRERGGLALAEGDARQCRQSWPRGDPDSEVAAIAYRSRSFPPAARLVRGAARMETGLVEPQRRRRGDAVAAAQVLPDEVQRVEGRDDRHLPQFGGRRGVHDRSAGGVEVGHLGLHAPRYRANQRVRRVRRRR